MKPLSVISETMKIEDHKKQLKESLEVLGESIEKGLLERQRNIGFNTSAASADLLEILLHKNDLIDPGFTVKHEWFNSPNKIKDKFPFDFPRKKEILALMEEIEQARNTLCYGKPQGIEVLIKITENFNRLKTIFQEVGVNEK